jgi:hypothetical protein
MNYKQFSQNIKTKYPQYQDIDDLELANKMIAKYPVYKEQVQLDDDIQQTEQSPQDESIIQKLLRMDRESAEKAEQRWRERGVADPDVQTIPEIAKGALNLASYLPVSAPLKLGKYAKGAYELGLPAALGAGARYIGEREKGQYAEDAASTAAKQAATEMATGALVTPALKLGKASLKKLSEAIPDDLYKKAKQFSQKTSKPLVERIEQLKKLGEKATESNKKIDLKMQKISETAMQSNKKIDADMQAAAKKAIESNKKIDTNLQKMAQKATVENKNTARKISDTMNKLSQKFFINNTPEKLATQIKNIPDTTMDALIENQHTKLVNEAIPIVQDDGIKRNREAEALLNDFRNRFMSKKSITKTKLEPSEKDPSILIPKKEKITEYSPIKNRVTFFKEMRLIADKSTFGEGKKSVGQSYARIHKGFNDFLKTKSAQYKDQKELGESIVNFGKLKPEIDNIYDKNKIQKSLKETLETFDKTPDPDSVRRLDDFLKQAKKHKFKADIDLRKYKKNLDVMQFEKAGTKGLTKEQIESLPQKDKKTYSKNIELSQLIKAKSKGITKDQLENLPAKIKNKYLKNIDLKQFEKSGIKGLTNEQIESLPLKSRENYLKNKDLAELTKEPLFTGTKKAEQVATDPSKMGRIMELLPPELKQNIEIEEAKRSYDALTSGLTASGEIPYVSPFVSKYFLASQIARKGLKSPAIQGYAKKVVEGDTAIQPEMIRAGAKLGARALPRQFFGTDSQRVDAVKNPMTGKVEIIKRDPFAIKRQNSGGIAPRSLQQIRQERGL